MKRFLALLLTLVMLVSVCGLQAFAADGDTPAGTGDELVVYTRSGATRTFHVGDTFSYTYWFRLTSGSVNKITGHVLYDSQCLTVNADGCKFPNMTSASTKDNAGDFEFHDTFTTSQGGKFATSSPQVMANIEARYKLNDPLYKPMYFKGDDIEVVITHAAQVGEEFYSFVNGQHTTQGGTHQTAFREALSRTIKEFYGKNFEYSDIRNGIVAAIAIKVEEPVFESQTKIKLGSSVMWKDGPTIYKFINDFIKKQLDDYLHKDADTAEVLLKKIQESERERKAIAGVTKQARERAKKVALNNSKLRDCRVHFNDARAPKDNDRREESSIFITEGLSASGSITKIRDVETQAVFSLRGKPLNTFGLQPAQVVQNEEFSLLQAALNIEDSIDNLRYNKVIVATDADVDGMHIRLLLLTYFLQFHPELIKTGHLYILQTPLFRVRNRKEAKRKSRAAGREAKLIKPETYYCYTDEERVRAINKLGDNAEITRFKGLGEISPDEFADFIGPDMRLDRVQLRKEDAVNKMLEFFMGKNTMERQEFIVDNLVIEDDEDITVH